MFYLRQHLLCFFCLICAQNNKKTTLKLGFLFGFFRFSTCLKRSGANQAGGICGAFIATLLLPGRCGQNLAACSAQTRRQRGGGFGAIAAALLGLAGVEGRPFGLAARFV